jgi:myosin heavy subunit
MEKLSNDVDDLCVKCSPAERSALRERFERMQQDFDRVAVQVSQRLEVCAEWTDYNDAHKTITDRMKALQKRLESHDLSPAEVEAISAELTELQSKLQELERKRSRLDSSTSKAETVVKDSASKQAVQTKTQLQNLQAAMMKTRNMVDERRGKLDELGKLTDKFGDKRDSLKAILTDIDSEVKTVQPAETSVDALKVSAKQLSDLDHALQSQNLQRAELHDLAGRISSLDRSQEPKVMDDVRAVEAQWNTLMNGIMSLQGHYGGALSLWKQYADAAAVVKKELTAIESVANAGVQLDSQLATKKQLAAVRSAEQEMMSHQRHLDQMSARGQQLASELKQVPGASADVVLNEVEAMTTSWGALMKVFLSFYLFP